MLLFLELAYIPLCLGVFKLIKMGDIKFIPKESSLGCT